MSLSISMITHLLDEKLNIVSIVAFLKTAIE